MSIEDEFRALGLEIAGSASDDWIPCRVFGKEDRTPSGGINVSNGESRGKYHDFTTGEHISIFDFAIKAGQFTNYFDALKYYSEKTGVALPKKNHHSEKYTIDPWNESFAVTWLAKKPPITKEAFLRAGGCLVKEKNNIRIGLPVYGVHLDTSEPIGMVVWDRLGLDMQTGPKADQTAKMKTVSGSESGYMGLFGLKNITNAEIVWKVEGPTDLLALESVIPEEHRGKHVVITNSGGASENPKQWQVEKVAGKVVGVIADCDDAGSKGAQKWAGALANAASEVRLVSLPLEKTKNKGRDLRDFFNDGGTYEQLLELFRNAPTISGIPLEKSKEKRSDLPQPGEIDPETNQQVLSTDRTQPTAEAFIRTFYTIEGNRVLFNRSGVFYAREGNCYRPVDNAIFKKQVFEWLGSSITVKQYGNEIIQNPFPANDTSCRSAIAAIETISAIPADYSLPLWLGPEPCPVEHPSQIIFGKTKNFYLPTMQKIPTSPFWFNNSALEFDVDLSNRDVTHWGKFLNEIFGGDVQSVHALMEFIGLLLTPITKFQKMLFIIGPKRSGKGTIGRIMQMIVGEKNCCFPTTDSMANGFGMQRRDPGACRRIREKRIPLAGVNRL